MSIDEAQGCFAELVQALRAGVYSEVILTVEGVPTARLLPYESVADDFDRPRSES